MEYLINSGVIPLRLPDISALWYFQNREAGDIQIHYLDLYLGNPMGALDHSNAYVWVLLQPTEGTLKAGSTSIPPRPLSPLSRRLNARSLVGAEGSTLEGGRVIQEALYPHEGQFRLGMDLTLGPAQDIGLLMLPKTHITQQEVLFTVRLSNGN